jgi:signal transduction histidine kinase
MLTGFEERMIKYLEDESSVIVLTIASDGTIIKSNRFATDLTGKKLEGINVNEIFFSFGRQFNITDQLSETGGKVLINITTASGLPGTYYFRFYNFGSSVLAIGEANSLDLELLRKNLLELNQELNNLSRELQKKNAELKKLGDLKNQFLGIAAHDLRNPLGIIMGYSSYLLEESEGHCSEDQIMMLKSILDSSEFMLSLLNNLLDISAIESGKLTLDLVKSNLVTVVKKNIGLNNVLASKKNILIHFDCFEKIPDIMFDVFKIEQVLNNLISNAIKYSQPGTKVNISIFLSGNNVTVAVADHGPGIPEIELEKLFKPFEKTSVKSTAGEKSTGLGLSIVRKLIIGHHGKIWVESKVGMGSTFYFSLPL